MALEADVVIIGAGAVGTSAAFHATKLGKSVIVIEKESGPALHQSGRNSGVIHTGYNLKPGSTKARFCIEGSRRLREYCAQKGVPVRVGGILVVARSEGETAVLRELETRARGNRTDIRMLDEAGIRAAEPHATGLMALHAREGASFDARAYVHALTGDAVNGGAHFLYDTRVHGIEEGSDDVAVRTTKGKLRARVIVNAAGLYADQLARTLAPDMRVIPFRGDYAELTPQRRNLVTSHIYAAPDLNFPFLGVHLSRRTDGRVILGPGAMLAFGREAYSFWSLKGGGLGTTLGWSGFYRMMMRPEFRRLIGTEVARSISLKAIWREARLLVPDLRPEDLLRSYAGNRAQQVTKDGKLVEDIVVRETARGVHVLNAVSPGLTCSLPFGEHLAAIAAKKA